MSLSSLDFFAVKAKAKIMIQQSCALILLISTYGAFAQFGCDNNTLPDGSSCPNDGHIDHVRFKTYFFFKLPE